MDRVRIALVILLPLACNATASDIGKPCATHEDCASGLECDVHDGQGTCQQPHDDTGTEEHLTTSHESEHETASETAHETASETAHETEHGQDEGSSSGAGSSSGTGSSSTGGSSGS